MELLTVKQAAEQLGVSREAVYSMIGDKTISLASVQIIPSLTGRIKKYSAHIELPMLERQITKRYSGEEWLIVGETIGTNDSYPFYAIPAAKGKPYYGAGNHNPDNIEICRSCGALKSKVSQSTSKYYCERLCWTLVDREEKR